MIELIVQTTNKKGNMKVITEGRDLETPPPPWWVGAKVRCPWCGAVMQLEAADAPNVRVIQNTDGSVAIIFTCPNKTCNVPLSVRRPRYSTSESAQQDPRQPGLGSENEAPEAQGDAPSSKYFSSRLNELLRRIQAGEPCGIEVHSFPEPSEQEERAGNEPGPAQEEQRTGNPCQKCASCWLSLFH